MSRNVEVKVRVDDPDRLRARLGELGAQDLGTLRQQDVYFAVPNARLKVRVQALGGGELIAYVRPDRAGPRTSTYEIFRTLDPQRLIETLSVAFGTHAEVSKRRQLFLLGRTRVHLDDVEGKGVFLELEVALGEGEEEAAGEAEAERALAALGLGDAPRIAGSYADLT